MQQNKASAGHRRTLPVEFAGASREATGEIHVLAPCLRAAAPRFHAIGHTNGQEPVLRCLSCATVRPIDATMPLPLLARIIAAVMARRYGPEAREVAVDCLRRAADRDDGAVAGFWFEVLKEIEQGEHRC